MKQLKHILLAGTLTIASLPTTAQTMGIKTNLAGWATTTTNIGLEVGVSDHSTIQMTGYLNPWSFSNERHFRLWTVQPEYRYWFCGKFNGNFLGVHALAGEYNAKKVNFPLRALMWGGPYDENKNFPAADHAGWWPNIEGVNAGRHIEGWYVGVGFTCGHQWTLSSHWNFEASLGAGYVYSPMTYYGRCQQIIDKRHLNYVGPTNVQLSFMYVFQQRKENKEK